MSKSNYKEELVHVLAQTVKLTAKKEEDVAEFEQEEENMLKMKQVDGLNEVIKRNQIKEVEQHVLDLTE